MQVCPAKGKVQSVGEQAQGLQVSGCVAELQRTIFVAPGTIFGRADFHGILSLLSSMQTDNSTSNT